VASRPQDEFKARGDEHGRFLGSNGGGSSGGGGGGAAPVARAGRLVDAGRHNAFAQQVPLFDDY